LGILAAALEGGGGSSPMTSTDDLDAFDLKSDAKRLRLIASIC
jgi:hypothetical protein